ncbi:MAG: class I SAM-dependent methyltransferase [Nitrospirota bacterium]
MCNVSGIIFGVKNLTKEEIQGKRVLEIGSYDANGSLRPVLEIWQPAEYIGADIEKGPGVDVICNVEDIIKEFGKESFDVVISTEVIEHVRDWRKALSNIKNICKPDGIILITTRSYGYPYHPTPCDFWRYESDDMKNIFSDCELISLEKDRRDPGIFVKVRKPMQFVEKDLSDYELHSMVINKRVREITDSDLRNLHFLWVSFSNKIVTSLFKIGKFIFNKLQ